MGNSVLVLASNRDGCFGLDVFATRADDRNEVDLATIGRGDR